MAAPDKEDLESLFARRAEIDRALLEEHSRELTILFTDIVGSTQYFETKGDIAGLELVRRHNELLFPIVRGHQGWIVKTIGDAIMAVFADPGEAARCAVAMQRALRDAGAAGGEPIHIRVGAHLGRAIVDEGKDVYGDAVNTAARVVNQAAADEIVVSRALADRLPQDRDLHLVTRGSFQPKGKTDPVHLVSLHWKDGQPPPGPAAGAERHQLFVLELQVGARGLKVAALDGPDGKGTVKAYADVDVSTARLDELAGRYVNFMRGGGGGSYVQRVKELGANLYQSALSDRARRHLGETKLRFLRLHLDDHLVHVPWELMHDGTEFLCLRFAVGRVVSARAETSPEVRLPSPGAGRHAVVVSNASGDLDAAVREGEAVAGLLRDGWSGEVRHLLGPVRREELLSALSGCGLLHFAGHAEEPGADKQGGPGGLRLADGIVTAEEVTRAVGAAAPPLVFVNSCHASTGEGFRAREDGGADLASAFLLRGSRHFVGPRWEIADEDALGFALRFYEKVLAGMEFGEAVRQARHALMGPGTRPLSFAGYVLYGDPRGTLPAERIRLGTSPAMRSSGSRDNLPALPTAVNAEGPPRRRFPVAAAVLGSVTLLVFGGAVAFKYLGPKPAPKTQPEPKLTTTAPPREAPQGAVRLCVLPFKNISGDTQLDFLRDGLTEAVMTDFGATPKIRLIERAQVDLEIGELEFSQSKYVDPSTRAKLGAIQGAEVVVMGGFQRAGKAVRAHARFVDVESGEILLAVKAEITMREDQPEALFTLQDELALLVRESVPQVVSRLRP